ncbi:MAG: hypothetical protein UH963_08625, partial [Agathobacter sp.]|nr:hypothetical protein [Agathobacter sp.]
CIGDSLEKICCVLITIEDFLDTVHLDLGQFPMVSVIELVDVEFFSGLASSVVLWRFTRFN